MPRLASVLLVAILAIQVADLTGLIVPEPCAATEASNAPDDSCPTTCVRCGCCAQPVVPALPFVAVWAAFATQPSLMPVAHVVTSDPREILHVPKSFRG